MKNKSLLILVLLTSLKAYSQYQVTVSKGTYTDLSGAMTLDYIPSELGYYVASNFIFPVFNRKADFNQIPSVPSNGGFLSNEGYLAVYEKPGYLNTIVFQCLQFDSFRVVNGTTIVSAMIEGTSPNRISKFEWKNLVNGSRPNEKASFQIWLHEKDSSITYHYGPNSIINTARQVKCGIIVINETFTELVDEINLEGSPTKPSIYSGLTTLSLPTLDTFPKTSTIYTFRRSSSASLVRKSIASDFNIFPNPTNGLVNFHFLNATDIISIEIYNHLGVMVAESKNLSNSQTLNLSNLAKGIYFIKVIDKNQFMSTKKLIYQ